MADEPEDLAVAELEVDVVDGGDAAEALDDAAALEQHGGVLGDRREPRPRDRTGWSVRRRPRRLGLGLVGVVLQAGGAGDEHRAQDVGPVEQVGRSGPVKRTSPFSMNTARSARLRATLTDCSTMTIVVPRRWISRTTSSSWPTIVGARPSDSSSIMSSSGRVIERAAEGEHLLLAAGEVAGHLARPLLEDREQRLDLVPWPPSTRSWSLRMSQTASRRFSATVSVGNTPLPPGISEMPRWVVTSAGRFVTSSPLKATVPRLRASPGRRCP